MLHQVQRFDPVGVGARSLGECLRLQLEMLPDDTPGKALAHSLANGPLERLPKIGVAGIAAELKLPVVEVDTAVQLLRSLDPRPGAQIGAISNDTYVAPDVVIWRQHGLWRVALADGTRPRVSIHRGYEGMIRHASSADASYLRGHLQEARWLLKSLEARGDTLLKVARCLLKQQAAFLEFGDSALRPLTLREVAARGRPARIDRLARDRPQVRPYPARHRAAASASSPRASTPVAAARPPARRSSR